MKNLPANAGNIIEVDLILALGRSPGEGNENPHWNSGLENAMDRGTWWAIVHGATKRGT